MLVITKEQEIINIEMEGTGMGQVESFNYLGMTLEDKKGQDIDIN